MTDHKSNATVNRHEEGLNLERMVPEYFRPDVISGDISQMKIPTVDELAMLGDHNAQDILWDMRHEEGKLRKLQKTLLEEIKSLQSMRKYHVFYCDWHGAGYAKLPEELEDELMRNGGSEVCDNVLRARGQKVFSCRFGRYIAEWCKQNPFPCQCNYQCHTHVMTDAQVVTGVIISNDDEAAASVQEISAPSEKSRPRCEHYAECYGAQPFVQKRCILSNASEETWEEVGSFLEMKLSDCKDRLDFSKKYVRNLTTAINRIQKERNDGKERCPSFDLRPARMLLGVQSGDTVVELSKTNVGDVKMHLLTFVRNDTNPVSNEKKFLFQACDGTCHEVKVYGSIERDRVDKIYLKYRDYLVLISNPEVRKVWLQNAGLFTLPFTVTELEQAINNSARIFCPIKKFITDYSRTGQLPAGSND